jgi:site-specific DNA-methyltransferase (adenine-specific)
VIEMPTEAEPVKVVEGDCLGVLRALPDGCVDAVITDPPYGVSLAAHAKTECMDGSSRRRIRETSIANDDCLEMANTVAEWGLSRSVPTCLFASPYRPLPGVWRNVLVWDKGEAVGGGGDPMTCWKRTFEMIYIRSNSALRGKRDGSVLRVPVNTGTDFAFHPCQKPVALLRYLIRQITDPGDLILDPFAGSGTTGVAAAMEGRRCILIEKEPAYAAICRERVRKVLGKDGLFADL